MILRTEGLTKVFEVGVRRRKVAAVDDVSLTVEQGEIFGFVGPNGPRCHSLHPSPGRPALGRLPRHLTETGSRGTTRLPARW